MSEVTAAKRLEVAIGIVVRDGWVLIARRRAGDTFGDYWEFPGGKREASESPAECVRRELAEELEIDATAARALPVIEHAYAKVQVTLYPFLCRLERGEPRAVSAAEVRWVRPAELAMFRFPEANDELLKSLAAPGGIDLPGGGA